MAQASPCALLHVDTRYLSHYLRLNPLSMFDSAYCGGLWLASLVVMCKMAELLEKDAKHRYYRDILDRGSAAFDKLLWNGEIIAVCDPLLAV